MSSEEYIRMSCIAIITARGGSKRIQRKNVKEFMGRPMIAYAIGACLGAGIFDEVMVSTEDAEIAGIAEKYGARVPFMRSERTASDFATTYEVLQEVVAEYRKRGKAFDMLCCVYPCVPFLEAETLKEAYERIRMKDCDGLTPVVKYASPIQRALRVNAEGFLEHREPENALKRSQDLEPMYHDAGMFYFWKIDALIGSHGAVRKKTYIEMDEALIQDIDSESDWHMAELKYKVMHGV